jgi:hypothetical protein
VTKTLEALLQAYESLTKAERDAIPLEDFAWPEERKYPIDTQDHLDSAATLIGHAPEAMQPKIKARAIRIAKRHGFTLPDAWKDDDGKQEETQESVATLSRPKKKIGTLPICWLEYNARSLNGRIYPKATCDAIFRAAQRKLADPNALPPTTFVSHEAANGNVNTNLIGAPVKVWQEGSKFWAHIDIADTSVARDILGLAEGKYLRSGSMRVQGVELMHDRNYDLPIVVVQEGVEPEFLGIDLTTRPGLAEIARIPQVLYESDGRSPYIESFSFEVLPMEKSAITMNIDGRALAKEVGTILEQIKLAGVHPARSTPTTEAMTPDRQAHQRAHDHIAGVLDECLKPMHGTESARLRGLVEAELSEAGRALAMKHAKRLAAAHDEAAQACGMECEGCYNDILNIPLDPDNDGDSIDNDTDHDNESVKGQNDMTEEEMLAALKAKGYTVAVPKTVQEELEELRAKVAALEESRISEAPQRQTQAPSAMNEAVSDYKPEELYQEGDYLKGPLAPRNWQALANPKVPWPKDVDPGAALKELAPFLAYRLNMEEAHARGRDVSAFIGEYEQV